MFVVRQIEREIQIYSKSFLLLVYKSDWKYLIFTHILSLININLIKIFVDIFLFLFFHFVRLIKVSKHQSMDVQDCEIILDNPWSTYYAGHTVNGLVKLTLNSPTTIQGA